MRVAPVRSAPRILTAAPARPEVGFVSTNGARPTDRRYWPRPGRLSHKSPRWWPGLAPRRACAVRAEKVAHREEGLRGQGYRCDCASHGNGAPFFASSVLPNALSIGFIGGPSSNKTRSFFPERAPQNRVVGQFAACGNPARSRLSSGSGRLKRRLRPRLAALQAFYRIWWPGGP